MAMERLESAVSNWPLAPYGEKADTDANFKRMLQFALKPENAAAVRLGVASHNLFDLAYAHQLAHRSGTEGHFSFEMLSGMADHLRRALRAPGRTRLAALVDLTRTVAPQEAWARDLLVVRPRKAELGLRALDVLLASAAFSVVVFEAPPSLRQVLRPVQANSAARLSMRGFEPRISPQWK